MAYRGKTTISVFSPETTEQDVRDMLERERCSVVKIVEQKNNQGGWIVTLKGETSFSSLEYGENKTVFIDPRDKEQGYFKVSLFFSPRKKPDDKPQPATKRVSFQEPPTQERFEDDFPSLGKKSPKAKSVGGSWAAKVAPPAAEKELQELIKQAMERKANAKKMKAKAVKEEEAAEKELQELLEKAEEETKKLQKLLQDLRPSAGEAAAEAAN